MKNRSVLVLIVALVGVVVGALGVLWIPLTFIGAVIAAIGIVWQYAASRVVHVHIDPADWTLGRVDDRDEFSFTIPAKTVGGRHKVVTVMLINGELQEVLADVGYDTDGAITIRSGSRDDMTVHLS